MTIALFGSMAVYATTTGYQVADSPARGHVHTPAALPQNDIDQEAAGAFDDHKSQDRYLDTPAQASDVTADASTIGADTVPRRTHMDNINDSNSISEQRDNTVVSVQEALNNLDYDAGTADGVMGPNTMAALEKFQRENDLAPTGRLNAETLEALEIDNKSMYNDDLEDSAFAE